MTRRSEQERAEREQRLEDAVREQEQRDLAGLMSLPAFRRYLYAKVYRNGRLESLSGWGDETRALHEGRRGLAYEMAQEALDVAPHEYVLMRKEAIDDGLTRLAQLEAIEGGTR